MFFTNQKLTTMFQKLTITILLFFSLGTEANEMITLGITGVALKKNVSTLVKFKNYLIQRTGLNIKIKFARSYSTMRHLILDNSIDVAYICGATYVDLLTADKVELLALPTVNHKPYYYSLIISKKNTDHQKITDFKNTVFAMSDPESNSGSLAPRYEISIKGNDEKHFFKKVIYTYDHGESIKAVLDGFAQGASVDSVVYDAFLQNYPKQRNRLKIVQKLGPYPMPPFVISKSTSQQTKNKLQEALLSMGSDDTGKSILHAMAMDGFIKPDHFSYEKIKQIKRYLSHIK